MAFNFSSNFGTHLMGLQSNSMWYKKWTILPVVCDCIAALDILVLTFDAFYHAVCSVLILVNNGCWYMSLVSTTHPNSTKAWRPWNPLSRQSLRKHRYYMRRLPSYDNHIRWQRNSHSVKRFWLGRTPNKEGELFYRQPNNDELLLRKVGRASWWVSPPWYNLSWWWLWRMLLRY